MSTQSLNQEWFNYPGVKENYRTMVYYPGTGGSTFEFNFEGGYINREDIKAFMVKDDDREAKYLSLTFKGPNTVQTSEPVPVGWTVCIFRDTPKAEPLAKYQDGAVITAENLDRNAQQAMFAVSEMVDRFDSTVSQVEVALKEVYKATKTADEALAEAKKATGIANSAVIRAEQAAQTSIKANTTAESAKLRADQAAATAIDSKNTANALDAQIKTANATAKEAERVANVANATANGIDFKATQAQKDAKEALSTANEAKEQASAVDGKATQAMADAEDAKSKVNALSSQMGDVQAISNRVSSFTDGFGVVWKGQHTFNQRVQITRGDTTSWGDFTTTSRYSQLRHNEGGTDYSLRFGPTGLTFRGSPILTDGYSAARLADSLQIQSTNNPTIALVSTTTGSRATLGYSPNGATMTVSNGGSPVVNTFPRTGGELINSTDLSSKNYITMRDVEAKGYITQDTGTILGEILTTGTLPLTFAGETTVQSGPLKALFDAVPLNGMMCKLNISTREDGRVVANIAYRRIIRL